MNLVAAGPNTVTLRFVNTTNSLAFFEYRVDGVEVDLGDHPVVIGDVIHPGVCVDGRSPGTRVCPPGPATRTFKVDEKVEVRLALGGERDWDFDWVAFESGTVEG